MKKSHALLWERRDECPAAPVLVCHDEIVVECDAERVEDTKAWLEKVMIEGMEELLNGHEVGSPRLPVKVEGDSTKSWAG